MKFIGITAMGALWAAFGSPLSDTAFGEGQDAKGDSRLDPSGDLSIKSSAEEILDLLGPMPEHLWRGEHMTRDEMLGRLRRSIRISNSGKYRDRVKSAYSALRADGGGGGRSHVQGGGFEGVVGRVERFA